MKFHPKQIIFILLCLSNIIEGQTLKYAPHSQNIKGNVKKIDTYQFSTQDFDTLNISRAEELKGKLTVTRQFDKRTGNLLRIERFNDLGSRTVDLYYDENENIVKRIGFDSHRNLHDTTTYSYDYENLEMMQTSSRKSAMSVQGKTETIKNTRRTFDLNNNDVEIEYIGINDELLLFQKKYFDVQNRLVLLQDFEYTELEKTNIYTYDTLDRKRRILMIDKNGDITKKFIYDYIENGYEVSNFDSNGELDSAYRIVQFKDKHGNITKEYNFNLKEERTIIIEFKIEYFDE